MSILNNRSITFNFFQNFFLEELIKEYPKFDQPNLLESEGNIKFIDEKGHAVQLKVPLLTIVPISNISKDIDISFDKKANKNNK